MKGIERDYGKINRMIFLRDIKNDHRWTVIGNILFLIVILYFGFHIYNAVADTVVTMPDGTIHSCSVTAIGTIVCL